MQYAKKGKPKPDQSDKMLHLLETLDEILENGEKTLIFSQFKEIGDLLQQIIEEQYGFKPLFLRGGSTHKQRDDMVEAFQNLKAGGRGLNLTAASNVIHYDLWWNKPRQPAALTVSGSRATCSY